MKFKEGAGRETQEKKRVSKMHFLIHPAFTEEGSRRTQYSKYFDEARTYNEDELLVVFAPITYQKQFRQQYETSKAANHPLAYSAKWPAVARELKNILGPRLVVIGDPHDSDWKGGILHLDTAPQSWDKVKRILEARGYTLGKDMETEAYGEYLNSCVAIGASNLNRAADLNKKTTVRSDLTITAKKGPNYEDMSKDITNRLEKK